MATIETDRPDTAHGEVRMLIDGELVEAASGKRFDNVNPATEEVLGEVADAGVDDMQRAIAAARRAFDETDWSTNHAFRKKCLEQLHAAIVSEQEALRAELVAEVGTPFVLTYGPAARRAARGRPPVAGGHDRHISSGSASSRRATRSADMPPARSCRRRPVSSAPSCRGTTRSRCRSRRSARRSPPATP